MCGILGIVDINGSAPRLADPDVIAMRDRMESRGPDDATLLRTRNLVFAHRRLAIRDREGGRQPLLSQDHRYVLVYNGEIYNDRELRDELVDRGHQFATRCDTEVLLHAWQEWQEQAVFRLRGMFAFGVYDLVADRLTLVRDRLGVKPLYYSLIGNDFVFASSIAAIRRHPQFQSRPNLSAIRHYLTTLRLTFDNETVYDGIAAVRPGELIEIDERGMRTQFYWTTPVAEHGIDYTDAVEQVEKTLGESVAMHMVSDVPVGMMLSGGVDSNTLCDFVHRETNRPFVARCGGGDEPAEAQDDFRFARECAGLHDLDFDEVRVDSQHYLRDWGHLIKAYETPVSTPSDVIIFNVASALKRHVGVALGGEGADEACCGYEVPHWSGADFDLLASLDRLEPQNAEVALASLTAQYGDREIRSPSDLYLACNSLIPASAQRALFHEPMWKLTEEEHAVESWYQDLFAQYAHVPAAEQTAHVLLRTNLESLLARLDSATMLASLEARVPYADHLFVEQLFRLPHAHRIDVSPSEPSPWRSSLELSRRGSLRPKRLIYSIAQRRMPPQLADRRKCSFSTPVPKWLQSDWSEWLSKRVYNSPFAAEIFRPAALKQMEQLPAGLSMWHWGLANVILWGESCF